MNSRSKPRCRKLSRAIGLLALFSGLLFASCPCAEASARHNVTDARIAPLAPQFAIADFDGDQKPDLASVRDGSGGNGRSLYLIDFRLSTGLRRTFGLSASAGGLRLASRDVNGDHLPDVVVTTWVTDEPVAVFLGDGRGNFTRSEPAAFPGAFQKSDFAFAAQATPDGGTIGAGFSRSLPGTSVGAARLGPPPEKLGFCPVRRVRTCDRAGHGAWLGRAPPSRFL